MNIVQVNKKFLILGVFLTEGKKEGWRKELE